MGILAVQQLLVFNGEGEGVSSCPDALLLRIALSAIQPNFPLAYKKFDTIPLLSTDMEQDDNRMIVVDHCLLPLSYRYMRFCHEPILSKGEA